MSILGSRQYWIFSKRLTHDLGQKFEILSLSVLYLIFLGRTISLEMVFGK